MRRECKIPKAELVRRLAAGQTYRRIAVETGYGEDAVACRCQSLGLPAPRGGRTGAEPVVPEQVFRALLAQAELSLRDIGERIGVSNTAVHQRARRMGLPTQRPARAALALQVAA
jgi:hypothetical protein